MHTQTQLLKSFDTINNQTSFSKAVKDEPAKKKKSLFVVLKIKVKVFFWNLSPIHWFEDFKDIKITMEEFECKK
jgi:hypothetical protein